MMKRETPYRVSLPNGRTSVARYKRVTRAHLPVNIRLRRPYKKGVAPWARHYWQIAVQQGRGFGINILKFSKKIAKTPAMRELGN